MEITERKRLPIAEIEALYPEHFILIGDPEVNECNKGVSGIVLLTDQDKKDLFRTAGLARPGRFAIHRTKKELPGTKHVPIFPFIEGKTEVNAG